jgi:KDO2-lipid IV(A) lauroyltransferase
MDLEYLQYRVADVLSFALPRQFAYWIGLRVSGMFYRRDRRGREAVKANLAHIMASKGVRPGDETLDRMTRRTFEAFGLYLVDFFRYRHMTAERVDRMVTIEHPEYLDQLRDCGRGLVLVTAHLGNWELGGVVLVARGIPLNAVAMSHPNRRTDRLFRHRREQRGFRVICLDRAVPGCLAALARREGVALLMDRDYSGTGRNFPFFGKAAHFPVGAATLAIRTESVLFTAFLMRQTDDSFLLKTWPPIEAKRSMQVDELQATLCARLEETVAAYPTQWFMFEKFWGQQSSDK